MFGLSSASSNDLRFLYLSSLLGRPVLDASGRRVGRLADLVAATAEPYPPVETLVVAAGRKRLLQVPWSAVEDLGPAGLRLRAGARPEPVSDVAPPDRLRLATELLDRQIVDVERHRLPI